MNLEYEQLKKTAERQLESEWEDLQKTAENTDDGGRLADALLKLKELPSDARFTLECLLCGDKDSFLQNFKFVLDTEEWMRLPVLHGNEQETRKDHKGPEGCQVVPVLGLLD